MSLNNETYTLLLALLWQFTTIQIVGKALNTTKRSGFAADFRVNDHGDSGCFVADLVQRM